jgi:hypothetical protein
MKNFLAIPSNKLTERVFGTKGEEVKAERPNYLTENFITII